MKVEQTANDPRRADDELSDEIFLVAKRATSNGIFFKVREPEKIDDTEWLKGESPKSLQHQMLDSAFQQGRAIRVDASSKRRSSLVDNDFLATVHRSEIVFRL